MHEPFASTPVQPVQTVIAFARLSAAVDALSSAIAGFALLAGARAFMFIALLGWREPVLGGAGLVLLALVGWLRWQCGGTAAAHIAPESHPAVNRTYGAAVAVVQGKPHDDDARDVACYNRPSQCESTRRIAVEQRALGRTRTWP
ncbi:MAG TPA: hypothetical protein VGM85_02330 [Paraburkholderia sp.]|jgi:hypothetical protein